MQFGLGWDTRYLSPGSNLDLVAIEFKFDESEEMDEAETRMNDTVLIRCQLLKVEEKMDAARMRQIRQRKRHIRT